MAPPAGAHQPRVRLRNGWFFWTGFRMESSIPSGKESARRCRIDGCRRRTASDLREMSPSVQKHVGQCVSHLARRAEDVEVVAVREHAAAKAEHSIHAAGYTRRDGLHPTCEVVLARRLHEGMNVIVLDRVVNQSEAPAVARRSEAALELSNQSDRPQRRQPAPHLQRDVAGMTPRKRGARTMRISRIRAALAACARASSTPTRCLLQIEVELPRASCHGLHCDMQV